MAHGTHEMTAWLTKRTLDGVGDWLVVGAFALFLAAVAQWYLIDVRNYIEVTSIDVRDTVEGERIQMDVARVIRHDFLGKWSVEIRDAASGAAVCSTGQLPRESYWPYRVYQPSGIRTKLPQPLYLDYWAGGGCSDLLGSVSRPALLPPGIYSEETTHCVKAYWYLPQKCETWDASTFRILPKGQGQ